MKLYKTQGFHVEGRMLRYVRINVTFVEGKLGEEIPFDDET